MKNTLEHAIEWVKGRLDGKKKYETGLALSGGASRGFAHAGVIKALHENEIYPDIVAGASAGSIVGSFYCDGFAPEEIYEIFHKNKIFEIIKLRFNRKGLLNINGLRKILDNNLRTKRLEDLEKPFIITATNLVEAKTEYFTEGNLVDLVVASSSIPVIFVPTEIDGITYVDGGVTNNFPIEPLEDQCTKLIGSHVNPVGPFDPGKGILHVAATTFHLSIAAGIYHKKKKLDYFIEPSELSEFGYFDIKKGKEMYDIGYREAINVLKG